MLFFVVKYLFIFIYFHPITSFIQVTGMARALLLR